MNKNTNRIYQALIVILLVLVILLGIRVDKLKNTMKIKSKYYKPLDSRVTIKPSNIEGLGLFAVTDIEEGEVLGISHVYDERFKDQFIEDDFVIQIIHKTLRMSCLPHTCARKLNF